MSCRNCGETLEYLNQKFCQNCGSEIPPDISQLKHISPSTSEDLKIQVKTQMSIQKQGSGPYSKKCLGFGIVSLILAIITFNIGSSLLSGPILFYFIPLLRIFIVFLFLHILGLIFGSLSRKSYNKAKKGEFLNTALKAGNTIGILAFFFNIILLIADIVILAFFYA